MAVLINSLLSWYFKKRIQQVEYAVENPVEIQSRQFEDLILQGRKTEYGQTFGFDAVRSREHFRTEIPITDYETLKPYIDRTMHGEQNIIWPSEIKWFAKSSGTTSDKSKFIPVSFEALEDCQFKGGRDILTIYCHNNPETKVFDGKGLLIGGSHEINKYARNSYWGDLSAVMMNNLPFWVNLLRTPGPDIALMSDWEQKMDRMVEATRSQDVRSISGVPTWTLLLIRRLVEENDLDSILDIWPQIELYMHGGVSFTPYRDQFQTLIPSNSMHYLETYNASEGFFGIQDSLVSGGDMLLMMDYGIYYEFLPLDQVGLSEPQTVLLEEVEIGVPYALIISTNAGLWRYNIGDTIEFTSCRPYRFKITGRTKLFINAFGEELMIENAEKAIEVACQVTESSIRDYTAGPIYFGEQDGGGHEWLIEFERPPSDLEQFRNALDDMLKKVNSDYEAKRAGDMALRPPEIRICREGTFYDWLKVKGKLGGQHKVPRLSNDRKLIEEIFELQNRS
ncbi:MAG: GH3 auxin-responsive promoter family protein [Flavobacteriales bacterium]|nr:GH3 auxin-responsive promoter family protein [Flavobacteriales bacterium]